MKKMVDGVLMDMTEEDIAQYEAGRAEAELQKPINARRERDDKLKETDWTQLPDVPEAIQNAYKDYRQALRDVPAQDGFPDAVVWPDLPE